MKNNQAERRCLITGGAGFIGSHLVDALLAEGCHVTVADNFSTGSPKNLAHLTEGKNYKLVKMNVSDRQLMAPLVADCTELYHLASYVGVKLASQTSSQTILNNLRSIDTILDLVTHYRPKLLLTSTSEIYGKALDYAARPAEGLSEDDNRVYGSTKIHRWSYAGIKAVEEFLTLAKHHEEGLHTVIVRLFNIIGGRQIGLHGPVVPRFIAQALAGEPITIYGDGRQRRCFTYIDDAIKGLQILMNHPGAKGEIFNVGGSAPVTIKELAETVVKVVGGDSSVKFVPHKEVFGDHFEDVNLRIPNTDKLEALTGFKCNWALEDAIRDIVAKKRAE